VAKDEAIKVIEQMHKDYKIVFGSEEGQRVLQDLKNRCFFNSSTFVSDRSETILREGQRSVVLYINNILQSKDK
tara:strand:+ start:3871 stop:4092 length:222 start_codon:yes stop_codon:yes gene_type:complete